MPLELRKRKGGSLRPYWYGRFEIDGKRHCARLCRIAGKPHSSLSIKEAGNDAFEKSRQNARDQLVVKADQARDIQGVHGTLQRFLNFVKANHSTLVHAATGQRAQPQIPRF